MTHEQRAKEYRRCLYPEEGEPGATVIFEAHVVGNAVEQAYLAGWLEAKSQTNLENKLAFSRRTNQEVNI